MEPVAGLGEGSGQEQEQVRLCESDHKMFEDQEELANYDFIDHPLV